MSVHGRKEKFKQSYSSDSTSTARLFKVESEIASTVEFDYSGPVHGDLTGQAQKIVLQLVAYTDEARSGKVINY